MPVIAPVESSNFTTPTRVEESTAAPAPSQPAASSSTEPAPAPRSSGAPARLESAPDVGLSASQPSATDVLAAYETTVNETSVESQAEDRPTERSA